MNISDLNVDLGQLRDVDLETLANSPLPVKLLVAVVVAAVVVAGGWWFDWRDQGREFDRVVAEERQLRQTYEIRARRAANLDAYREQLAEMEERFGAMLRQLPSRAEVASLLVDISQEGRAAGLEFELFQPQAERRQEFYAEMPVLIRVRGNYHQFGRFISGVADLPRIVTLHNVNVNPTAPNMTMELTARTYWYLEEEDNR